MVRPWSPWSACSHECFTGRKYRTRAVIQISYHKRISEIVTLNTTSIYCNTEPCNDSGNRLTFSNWKKPFSTLSIHQSLCQQLIKQSSSTLIPSFVQHSCILAIQCSVNFCVDFPIHSFVNSILYICLLMCFCLFKHAFIQMSIHRFLFYFILLLTELSDHFYYVAS